VSVALSRCGCTEYGLPAFFESAKVHPSALIVSYLTDEYSHWNAAQSLSAYLKKYNVPGITGIDTRMLTKKLRVNGSMKGKLVIEVRL
jgi:carbamoyl-phosphate synthase small subunit